MVNQEKVALFKMKVTSDRKNIKELIGKQVKPIKWEFTKYDDAEGEQHVVLAIDLEVDGQRDIYRTETQAFINKFEIYIEVFGDEPENERPVIEITGKNSKRGNKYVNFELV